jgi:two-component sensor histidine kinase
VDWRVETDGDRFSLDWVEAGGPRVEPPTRQGFGSRLIARLAKGDLGGAIEIDYPPEGLRMKLTAPLL